jgi:uncharacterized protein YtpQ (UPF0354 family)
MAEFSHEGLRFALDVPEGWRSRFVKTKGLTLTPARDARGSLAVRVLHYASLEDLPVHEGPAATLAALCEEWRLERRSEVREDGSGKSPLAWCDAAWRTSRGKREAGRLWAFTNGRNVILASHDSPLGEEGEARKQIAREHEILLTLELHDPFAPTPAQRPGKLDRSTFAKVVIHRIRQGQLGTPVRAHGFQLVLENGMQLNLENLWRLCQDAPVETVVPAIDAWLTETVGKTTELAGRTPSLAEVRPRLKPLVKHHDFVRGTSFVHRDLAGDLVVVYVVDGEKSMRPVFEEWLEGWGLDGEELEAIALENLLEDGGRGLEFRAAGPSPEQVDVLMLSRGDGFDATRVIQPGFHDMVSEHLGESFLVAIPNRDFLVAFRDREPAMIEHFRSTAEEQARTEPWPLTGAILRVSRRRGVVAIEVEPEEKKERPRKSRPRVARKPRARARPRRGRSR